MSKRWNNRWKPLCAIALVIAIGFGAGVLFSALSNTAASGEMLAAAEEQKGNGKGICYRVTGGKNDMFLLGSIHVGNEQMYPMGPHILEALDAADTLVFECDTQSAEALQQSLALMSYPIGESLKDHVSKETYELVERVAKKSGYPMPSLNALRPWAVTSMLSTQSTAIEMGVEDVTEALALGVEAQIRQITLDAGKEIRYLETAYDQLKLMDDFSPALQEYLLQGTCQLILGTGDEAVAMDSGIGQWPQWWSDGNIDAFVGSYQLGKELDPKQDLVKEYHHSLVTTRNIGMANGLRELLENGAGEIYFVTVGLLHLVLPGDSVVYELRRMGYQVEPIME